MQPTRIKDSSNKISLAAALQGSGPRTNAAAANNGGSQSMPSSKDATLTNPNQISFKVPQPLTALLIGRNGSNLKAIEQQTETSIQVDQKTRSAGYSSVQIQGKGARRALTEIQQTLGEVHYVLEVNAKFEWKEIKVEQERVSVLIGPGGETLTNIQKTTGAYVECDKRNAKLGICPVGLYGTDRRVAEAEAAMRKLLKGDGAPTPTPKPKSAQPASEGAPSTGPPGLTSKRELRVEQNKVARVLGWKKDGLKLIEQKSHAKVELDQSTKASGYSTARIQGSKAACQEAYQLLVDAIENGLDQPVDVMGSKSDGKIRLKVAQEHVGGLLGKQGETLKKLQVESGTGIYIDQFTKAQGYSIVIINPGKGAEKARSLIMDMIAADTKSKGGGRRLVLSLPQWHVGKLVGAGGETIREMQQLTGAKIWIDQNSDPLGDCTVSVRGETEAVDEAHLWINDLFGKVDVSVKVEEDSLHQASSLGVLPMYVEPSSNLLEKPPGLPNDAPKVGEELRASSGSGEALAAGKEQGAQPSQPREVVRDAWDSDEEQDDAGRGNSGVASAAAAAAPAPVRLTGKRPRGQVPAQRASSNDALTSRGDSSEPVDSDLGATSAAHASAPAVVKPADAKPKVDEASGTTSSSDTQGSHTTGTRGVAKPTNPSTNAGALRGQQCNDDEGSGIGKKHHKKKQQETGEAEVEQPRDQPAAVLDSFLDPEEEAQLADEGRKSESEQGDSRPAPTQTVTQDHTNAAASAAAGAAACSSEKRSRPASARSSPPVTQGATSATDPLLQAFEELWRNPAEDDDDDDEAAESLHTCRSKTSSPVATPDLFDATPTDSPIAGAGGSSAAGSSFCLPSFPQLSLPANNNDGGEDDGTSSVGGVSSCFQSCSGSEMSAPVFFDGMGNAWTLAVVGVISQPPSVAGSEAGAPSVHGGQSNAPGGNNFNGLGSRCSGPGSVQSGSFFSDAGASDAGDYHFDSEGEADGAASSAQGASLASVQPPLPNFQPPQSPQMLPQPQPLGRFSSYMSGCDFGGVGSTADASNNNNINNNGSSANYNFFYPGNVYNNYGDRSRNDAPRRRDTYRRGRSLDFPPGFGYSAQNSERSSRSPSCRSLPATPAHWKKRPGRHGSRSGSPGSDCSDDSRSRPRFSRFGRRQGGVRSSQHSFQRPVKDFSACVQNDEENWNCLRLGQDVIGFVIGRGGSFVRALAEEHSVVIAFSKVTEDDGFRTVSIEGEWPEVVKAKEAIRARVESLQVLFDFPKVVRDENARRGRSEAPRASKSQAARHTMEIDPEMVGFVIGSGGSKIKSITEDTGVRVQIEQGTVHFNGPSHSIQLARRMVEEIVASYHTKKEWQAEARQDWRSSSYGKNKWSQESWSQWSAGWSGWQSQSWYDNETGEDGWQQAQAPSKDRTRRTVLPTRVMLQGLLGRWFSLRGELSVGGGTLAQNHGGRPWLSCKFKGEGEDKAKENYLEIDGKDVILSCWRADGSCSRRFYLDALTDQMATWVDIKSPQVIVSWARSRDLLSKEENTAQPTSASAAAAFEPLPPAATAAAAATWAGRATSAAQAASSSSSSMPMLPAMGSLAASCSGAASGLGGLGRFGGGAGGADRTSTGTSGAGSRFLQGGGVGGAPFGQLAFGQLPLGRSAEDSEAEERSSLLSEEDFPTLDEASNRAATPRRGRGPSRWSKVNKNGWAPLPLPVSVSRSSGDPHRSRSRNPFDYQ